MPILSFIYIYRERERERDRERERNICVYITEAGLAQSRASVGAKAASVARNKEG